MLTRRQATHRRMLALYRREVVDRLDEPAAAPEEALPELTAEEAELGEPLLDLEDVEAALEGRLREAPAPPPLPRRTPPVPQGGYGTLHLCRTEGE